MSRIKKLSLGLYTAAAMMPTLALAAACEGARVAGGTCSGDELTTRITNIINALFFIIGALAVIVLLYGAVRYITSTGDSVRIAAAKNTIIYAVAGLVIAILAPAIVGFVIGSLF